MYYNYRYYNPIVGNWISRDIVFDYNLYGRSSTYIFFDILGASEDGLLLLNTLDDIKNITFDDFLGVVPENMKNEQYLALASFKYNINNIRYICTEHYVTVQSDFLLYMDRNTSWKKANDIKNLEKERQRALLLHEQGHFVIAFEEKQNFLNNLHDRTKVELINSDSTTLQKAKKAAYEKLKNEFEATKNRINKQGEQYDTDTNHGIIAKKQKEYNIRFGLIMPDSTIENNHNRN